MLSLNKTGKVAGTILLGRMYSYKYFALPEEPLFDLFPIVLVTDVSSKWFEGLNLHYLDIERRRELYPLLNKFIKQRDGGNYFVANQFKQILYTKTFRLAQVCLRRYRKSNIRGRIFRIKDEIWESILYEDRERFLSFTAGSSFRSINSPIVWRESLRQSRGM